MKTDKDHINWRITIGMLDAGIRVCEDPIIQAIHIRGEGVDSLDRLIAYLQRVRKDIDAGYDGFVEE